MVYDVLLLNRSGFINYDWVHTQKHTCRCLLFAAVQEYEVVSHISKYVGDVVKKDKSSLQGKLFVDGINPCKPKGKAPATCVQSSRSALIFWIHCGSGELWYTIGDWAEQQLEVRWLQLVMADFAWNLCFEPHPWMIEATCTMFWRSCLQY